MKIAVSSHYSHITCMLEVVVIKHGLSLARVLPCGGRLRTVPTMIQDRHHELFPAIVTHNGYFAELCFLSLLPMLPQQRIFMLPYVISKNEDVVSVTNLLMKLWLLLTTCM